MAWMLVACSPAAEIDAGPGDAAWPDGGGDAGGPDAGAGDAGLDGGAPTGCAAGCAPDEYCETTPGDCGSSEERCSLVPELCPPGGEPVCGCDGATYSSDCERRRARVSKAFDGACAALVCDPPCTAGLVCWYAAGGPTMGCGLPGECALPTPECDFVEEDPVCGCDGVTYRHEFCAVNAGAGIASRGACP